MTANTKRTISLLSLFVLLLAGAALAADSHAEMTDFGYLGPYTDELWAQQYAEGTPVAPYVDHGFWGPLGDDMKKDYQNATPIKPCLDFGYLGPVTEEQWNQLRQQ